VQGVPCTIFLGEIGVQDLSWTSGVIWCFGKSAPRNERNEDRYAKQHSMPNSSQGIRHEPKNSVMINKNRLKAILKKIKAADYQCFETDKHSIRWLPIVKIEETDGTVGISSEGDWVFVKKGGMKILNQIENFFVIHPLLRQKRTLVIQQFRAGLKNLGLTEVIIKTFPFDELMMSAINAQRVNQVIDWLNDGYPPNDMIAQAFSKRGTIPSAIRRWQNERIEKITQI